MTPHMEARLRAGIQNYLDSGNREPVTVRDLFGPGWDDIPPRARSTLGAWMLKKVRKGTFPEVRPAGRNAGNSMTYFISDSASGHG